MQASPTDVSTVAIFDEDRNKKDLFFFLFNFSLAAHNFYLLEKESSQGSVLFIATFLRFNTFRLKKKPFSLKQKQEKTNFWMQ